jgi:hypothetical protein
MLSVSLEASFSSNGSFDFDATMSGLAAGVTATDFGVIRFDPTDVLAAVGGLLPPDLAGVVDAAGTIAGRIDLGAVFSGDADQLLQPLRDLFAPIDAITGGVDLTIPSTGIGLDVLGADVGVALGLIDGPLQPLVDLLRSGVPGLDLSGAIGDVTASVGGAIALVRLLGGLIAVETVTAKVERGAALVGGVLDATLVADDAARLGLIVAGDLPNRIAAVDLQDTVAVDALVGELRTYAIAVRAVQESWSTGLGFGEAALVGLDVTGSTAQMAIARAALDESLLPAVGSFASSVRGWLEPVMTAPLPDPEATLDDTYAAIVELADPLRSAIDRLDTASVADAIAGGTTSALTPVLAVTNALESVSTAIGGSLREIRALVESIDLQPVIDGVRSMLQPITAALDAIDDAISVGSDAIETVAASIIDGLGEVEDAISEVASLVETALGGLADRLDEVDFEAVQAAISGGLGQVAATLASAQLTPYFDAANEIIDTTADVIDNVPFGLLPTDVQQEIVDLSRPVKEIDFDAIADTLRTELRAILTALDDDVLDEVDAAYRAVIAFLESIDPGAAIAEFEAGPFAELRATIDGIDPEVLLAEVDATLEPVRSLLDGIDLRDEVLSPVAGVFDEIRAGLDQLDPATLLQPVTAEVDALRQQVEDAIHLTTWATSLERSRDRAVAFLGILDPVALADAATDEVVARLRADRPQGPGLLGTVVGALAQATGLSAEASCWPSVRRWFGEIDGRTDVTSRLSAAAGELDRTRLEVHALDPEPVVNAAQAYHRRLLSSLQGLPADARLRVVGEPIVVDNAPASVLAPLVENRVRYLARLDVDATALGTLAATGLSQIDAVTDGLTDALAPIRSVLDWVRSLAGRFGLQDLDRPFADLLADLLAGLGPQRLLGVVGELIGLVRDKLVTLVDAAIAPILDAVAAVEQAVALIDLGPIVDELAALHADVVGFVDALDPANLLRPVLDDADALIDRVAGFDPLAPVRLVIDELRATIDTIFDTAAPSVVFAPVTEIYATLVGLASGLDVRGLLQPILDALAGLEAQLETGIDATAIALGHLQDALPDHVEDAAASVSGSLSVGLSL